MKKKLLNWCGSFEKNMLWIIFGIVIGLLLFTFLAWIPKNWFDILKVLGYLFISVSVVIAAQQFRFNREQAQYANEWNKKQLAISRLHDSRHIFKKTFNHSV